MATSTNRRRAGTNQQQSLAPLVGPVVIALAAVALYFGQPGLVLVWLGVLLAAWMHPGVELTGKKDSYGRHTPADLTEERKLADHAAMLSLRWRILVPGAHWLPGWPPLGYWLFAVALTVLAYAVPVLPLEALATNEDEGAQLVAELLVTFGRLMNAAATFLTATAVFATLRQRAGDDCPGTRMSSLVTLLREHRVRTIALTAGTPLVAAGLVLAARMVAPELAPLLDLVPVWAWVVLALTLALGVHAPFLREDSLKDWREIVAARRQWDGRWPAVKMDDPMALLVERLTVGANTVDVFEAPASVGASGYLGLAPKLTPVLGAGRTVVILNDPQVGPDGAPVPGTVDPVRFRVVDIDDNAPVDLTDPGTEPDVASTMFEAGMARATDMLGVPRASLVSLEPVQTPDSPRAAWRAVFAGLSWAGLRPQVAMLPGFFGGAEVLIDHRGGQMFVGALLNEPATFADPGLAKHLTDLSVQDHWNVIWGAASLARHKVSQPAVSPAQCAKARLADGTEIERTVFITRVGIPPADYFGTEDKVAASLNGAPFVAITGYPGSGNRPGERHPQALSVYSSPRPVPATLDVLAPVEGSTVAQVDAEQPAGPSRPGRPERRRPARRPGRARPTASSELATHWVIAGMVNKAFESNRLKRPEVVEARALTVPSPRGPHLWRVQLRLHDGVTLSDVRASAEKLRQSLGVPWLRVAQAPDGVTLYVGATPAVADLVNPVTDRATLVSLDWERAFDDAKLVSSAGEVPSLLEVGHLPKNTDVQVLDFGLPSGLSTDRIKGALKKLMASTGNEFVEVRSSPRGASAFRLLVAREHPLPSRVDFDYDTACSDRRHIYFATGIEGEPVGWDVKDSPHCLLAGTTGSGKSVLAQNFLWGWIAHGDQAVVIDPMKQAADFQFLAPYASGFAVDVTEAAALLKAIYVEVRRRMALNAAHKVGSYLELPDDVRPRRLLVFIDEFTSLMGKDAVPPQSTDPDVMEERARVEELNEARGQIGMFVGKLAREARSAGVHLALGTQALKSDTLQKLPGSSDLKTNLARTLLGNSTQGDRMSALRNPMDAPALGESIPKGRGLWEPLTSPVAIAVQTWFAPQTELAAELAARIQPLAESERIDYAKFLPKAEEDDHTYGPPPGFGEDEGETDEAVTLDLDESAEVLDLGDLELDLDLDDLEVDTAELDLDDVSVNEPPAEPASEPDIEPVFDLDHLDGAATGVPADTEPDFDLDHLEDTHDRDDQPAPEGGEGTAPEGGEADPDPDPDDLGPEAAGPAAPADEGGAAEEEGAGRPGVVDAPADAPAGLPVAGGADAAGAGPDGFGPDGDDGGDDGRVPSGRGGAGDEPGVDPAAAGGVMVPRLSSPWDDDDEFDGPLVAVAPDRRRLSDADLLD